MSEVSKYVQRCVTLASLLEVSAYPKPGNVHRTRDHPDTRFEHFLAGGVAMGEAMRSLAAQGYKAEQETILWRDVGLGGYILRAVQDTLAWQKGGNVNLGIILLSAPISTAAGALNADDKLDLTELRDRTRHVIKTTTPADAVAVYKAIGMAMSPETLGRSDELDVLDEASEATIRNESYNLYDVFSMGAERDIICREYVTGYSVTFDSGYPYLLNALEEHDTNTAIVNTFLHILSENPDTLITRKVGEEKAKWVSNRASDILLNGGATTEKGLELLDALDQELQEAEGTLNPGSTADLTAASIFLTLLDGWRP